MERVLLGVVAGMMTFSLAAAEEQPDFSGTWKMDPTRSESAHQAVPIGAVRLIIQQTASEFRITTKRGAYRGSAATTESLSFELDGKEATIPGNSGAPIRVKARWDGPRLVAETVRDISGSTVATIQGFELSADSKEMTVQKSLTVQHGYQGLGGEKVTGSGKDVFVRIGN